LKLTEEERAILHARSAVQRFPVVEWRQRMEDFHKRSINSSRHLAGHDAWRPSDGATGGAIAIAEHDDCNPVVQAGPSQPEWDAQSVHNTSSPRMNIPGSPGQWSQKTLTPGGDPFLHAPPRIQDGSRLSISSNTSDVESDYRASTGQPEFGSFLDKANRTIAKDQRHAPDPFLETPSRPFGPHSRVSSVESIASIVDEKANSPLNKAIASVRTTSILCRWLGLLIMFVVYRCRWWRRPGIRGKIAKLVCGQLKGGIVYREVPHKE